MPDSLTKTCWNAFLLMIIVINIFYIPLQIAFNMEDLNVQLRSLIKFVFELIPTITYTFDIFINFNTAFYKEGLIHKSRKKIIINYIGNNDFFLDFIAVIPFYLSYFFKITYLQFLLLIRITKVSKLVKNLEEVLNLRERYSAVVDLLKLVYLMLFVSHYCACAFFYIGILEEREGMPSWLSHYNLLYSARTTQYINSVYWSTITILTVGYGDITPTTNEEKKQQIQDESEGQKLIYELNEELRQEVLVDIFTKILVQSKFLAENVSTQCLNELCNYVKTQKYHANEVIFQKGQLCSRLYFLKSGSIQIYYQRAQKNNSKVMHTPLKNIKNPGHVLCEKQFILNQFCEYSAKATKITEFSSIEYKDFMEILKNHPEDYEKFCLMKDNLIFNKHYKKVTTVCEICGFLHSFGECPFPFYQANKDKIISEENKVQTINRQQCSNRRPRLRFNYYEVQNLALIRILSKNLIDINILTDDYLDSLGFADIKQDYETKSLNSYKAGKMQTIQEEEINFAQLQEQASEDNISKIQNERNPSTENQIRRFKLQVPPFRIVDRQSSAISYSQQNQKKLDVHNQSKEYKNEIHTYKFQQSYSENDPSSSIASINQTDHKKQLSLRNITIQNKNGNF